MKTRTREPRNRLMKVIVLGPSSVGKTALINKLVTGEYSSGYKASFACDFKSMDGFYSSYYDETKLTFWDMPGKDQFMAVSGFVIRGADFVIICCDKANANPEADLQKHTAFARRHNSSLPIFILQTKADELNESKAADAIAAFIEQTEHCYDLGEVSAKNNASFEIKDLFTSALRSLDSKNEACLRQFFEKRAEIAGASWKPKLFTRSNIARDSSWEELILDARHKKTANANKAFLALGWLDENGDLTDSAPEAMIEANEKIQTLKMEFKRLK